ncbi:MAG: MtsA protein [Archangium sp.]|nr:MtsA protein [Archangium sp.]
MVLAACRSRDTSPPVAVPSPPDAGPTAAQLSSIGPRFVSNQASQPLSVVGTGLRAGMTLHVGAPVNVDLPLTVLDATHAYTRLPAGVGTGGAAELQVTTSVVGLAGEVPLRIINDVGFPDFTAMAASSDGKVLMVVSGTDDSVLRVDLQRQAVERLGGGDGPSAIAVWREPSGTEWFVVAHIFEPSLRLLRVDGTLVRSVPAPLGASGLAIDPRTQVAFVADSVRDAVTAIHLGTGAVQWTAMVDPNPRSLALTSSGLAVGSLQTGNIEVLDVATGTVLRSIQPKPGTPIVGGTTEKYDAYVMNGKAPRAFAVSARAKRLFVSSIGPNIGPNPDKMEVSMNGGVGVVDPASGWVRHLGFGAGVTEGLAVDDARGLLYVADIGLGLVRVLDVAKLVQSDASAATAQVHEVPIQPPDTFPRARPVEDYGVKGRAGVSSHSGPKALLLSGDGKTLRVLNRFTGTLATLDVSQAKAGKVTVVGQLALGDTLGQRARRMGQVLYFADLGRTAMSCDACHLEGHTEGMFFEKTMPLRIYRSPTVRGSLETPPYFTPASTHSMGETMKVVGGRNRYHNPNPSPEEIEALTIFGSAIATLPNPFVGADGAPKESLELPDGTTGSPRAGLSLFEGKAGCAKCHPSPLFTLDQSPGTRAQFLDVGTPHVTPLREKLQNGLFRGFGTPSLLGAWDVFPMLTTGLAGLEVRADESLGVATRFPLRVAVEQWAPAHGRADTLSPQERNDLLAYVMSL